MKYNFTKSKQRVKPYHALIACPYDPWHQILKGIELIPMNYYRDFPKYSLICRNEESQEMKLISTPLKCKTK